MRSGQQPRYGIVPPHILHALLKHESPKVRDMALRTLTASAGMRERRRLLGRSPAGNPTGELRRTIYDDQETTDLPGERVRGEGEPPVSDTAVNQAYDGLGATYQLLDEVYRRNSIDDRGMRLDATVHYDHDYGNAFWDGQQMVFGDGDGEIFIGFTNSLDVIGHELCHGVTQYTADLYYHNQSGALNESMSDVFGSLVKQYNRRESVTDADWIIGAGILAPGIHGKGLRSMKAPGTAYDDPRLGGKDPQPAHMDDYVKLPDTPWDDNGGVHVNSGIPNRAFYLVCEQLGGYAWEDPGHIWYAALQKLGSLAQFADCAQATLQVAGTLFGSGSKQQQAVQAAWDGVGVAAATGQPPRKRKLPIPVAEGKQLKKRLREIDQQLKEVMEGLD